jgi:hypothetical protein
MNMSDLTIPTDQRNALPPGFSWLTDDVRRQLGPRDEWILFAEVDLKSANLGGSTAHVNQNAAQSNAAIPFIITRAMRAELEARGYSSDDISKMTPQEAHNILGSLEPDRGDAESFLAALDPAAAWFTFQTFDDDADRKAQRFARVLHGSLDKHWETLYQLNTRGAGVFVTVNETDGQGREAKNIKRVRVVFVDLDGAPLPEAFHAPPHIITQTSPGRWHIYWRVKDCPLEQFTSIQKLLIKHYKGDPAIHDLPRVMRIPGFIHRKAEPFRSCLVEAYDHDAYTVEQVTVGLPVEEKAKARDNGRGNDHAGDKTHDDDDPFRGLNTHALEHLDQWVPQLFPSARKSNQGWRVTSASLGRNLEEDISFTPNGIKDFGVHDMGDANEGRRTPIAIVMEWKPCDKGAAIRWLCDMLGIPADNAPPFSEEAIAIDFANRHADGLRYVAKWNQWLRWDGTCWREDETRRVFTIARGICRETAITINKASERKKIASAKTRAAVVSLAGEDPRLAATVDQWDTDPWLLNTPNGVVDLRTGKMREHRAEDYMTKQAAVSPSGDCPRWKEFMREITAGDKELEHYLQRVGGYCLTGVTREQELFFLYGTGNNGKGVFVNTLAGILKDYHRASSIETFTVSQTERHRPNWQACAAPGW